jgi:hypothetical protein
MGTVYILYCPIVANLLLLLGVASTGFSVHISSSTYFAICSTRSHPFLSPTPTPLSISSPVAVSDYLKTVALVGRRI